MTQQITNAPIVDSDSASSMVVVAVGVDFYDSDPPASSLSCATNDAEGIYATFNSRRNKTHTQLLTNHDVTIDSIKDAVLEAGEKVHKHGTLLFSFSGHGIPVPTEDGWEATFLTSEFQSLNDLLHGNGRRGAFSLGDVVEWLNEAGIQPKNIVFVMDACGPVKTLANTKQEANDVVVDERAAIARRVSLDEIALDEIGVSADEPVVLASELLPWSGTCGFFACSAATGGGFAYEVPEVGHGALTLFTLEWLNNCFLMELDGSTDFGQELFDYVQEQLQRMQHTNGRKGTAVQQPARETSGFGKVAVPNTDKLLKSPLAPNLIALGRTMPVPKPYGDANTDEGREALERFEHNIETIAKKFNEVAQRPGDANFVVNIPRFHGTRALLQQVATRVSSRAQATRPVLYLSLGRIKKILPLIGSLETAFEEMPGRQTNVAAGPPLIGKPSNSLIDNFVERLSASRAFVVAPFREQESDKLMIHFLERCARNKNITLVLALYAGEPIPEWASRAHFRKIQLALPTRESFSYRFAALDIRISIDDIPSEFFNDTVLHWLEILRERKGDDDFGWRNDFGKYALPQHQSGNSVRSILNVLEDLFPALNTESPEALLILNAMSVISLPRSEYLVRHLWERLRETGRIASPPEGPKDDRLEAVLQKLIQWRLVRESASTPEFECPRHFFVHSLVREAAKENECKNNNPDESTWSPFWHQIAGEAIRNLLNDESAELWWPRAILAHEAIRHLLEAGRDEDACRVLLNHWREFVDNGYHEGMLEWAQELYTGIVTTSLGEKENLQSLELLIPLLVNQQTLHKHRQEWSRILELHREVEDRVDDYKERRNGHGKEADRKNKEIERWSWKSRHNLANYSFITKDFGDAINGYEACYKWAQREHDLDLEFASQIRIANCEILQTQFGRADQRLKEVESRLSELPPYIAHRHRRHLRSVRIEACRLREDRNQIYELAVEAWTEALQSYGQSAGQERFDLAIANVHMGWASMVRGEFLRAWRHALQARRFLNDRGIAEHWWYGETERIAALAIAHAKRPAGVIGKYRPWFRQLNHPDSINLIFTEKVRRQQRETLEELIKVCRYQNPWRAAELMSALGQLLAHAEGNVNEGIDRLLLAERLAKSKKHHFLEVRILESLALISLCRGDEKGTANYFERCREKALSLGIESGEGRYTQNCREFPRVPHSQQPDVATDA